MTAETVQELRPSPSNRRGLGLLLASTGVAVTGQGMVLTAAPLLAASLTRNPLAVSVVTAASYAALYREIVAHADGEKEEILLASCDLGRTEEIRQSWPFLRDRRIDAYGPLLSRSLEDDKRR